MVSIHVSNKAFRKIYRHLLRKGTEQVVFLFVMHEHMDGDHFQIVDYYLVPSHELVHESALHAEVTEDAQARMIKKAWDKGLALGEIHSHTAPDQGMAFSPSDLAGFAEFVPHVWWRLKGKPYAALVFGAKTFDGLVWLSGQGEPVGVDHLVVGKNVYTSTGRTARRLERDRANERYRYSRQTAFFGKEGQEKLKKTRVAIAGLGGLGSHVAQQLAYLGVKHYALIDRETVDWSNLNRLIGATEQDVGRAKVEIAERLIRGIQPAADVSSVNGSVCSREAFSAIKRADVVFGCVDEDRIRLPILELACVYRKPYVDAATDIPNGTFGGRVVFTGIGKGCLMCRDELDQKGLWRSAATQEQREEDDRIYGVDRKALGQAGPSVVMLNGVVASLALTEFVVWLTGVREALPLLTYRGHMGIVTKKNDTPNADCFYCAGVWSGQERIDLQRHLMTTEA